MNQLKTIPIPSNIDSILKLQVDCYVLVALLYVSCFVHCPAH